MAGPWEGGMEEGYPTGTRTQWAGRRHVPPIDFPICRPSRQDCDMLRIAALLFLAVPAAADDWPQFRGPTGDGHYTGPTLPTEWGPDKNVAWKTPIPGKGWSSPIISKGKVYLTTAIPKHGGQSLHVICLDVESGKIDWDKELRL